MSGLLQCRQVRTPHEIANIFRREREKKILYDLYRFRRFPSVVFFVAACCNQRKSLARDTHYCLHATIVLSSRVWLGLGRLARSQQQVVVIARQVLWLSRPLYTRN